SPSSGPTVLFSPNNASPSPATITLSGSGFTGATQVLFSTVAATNLTVLSDAQLTVTRPAPPNFGTPASPKFYGVVDITVTTPNGTSAVVAADQYSYQAGGASNPDTNGDGTVSVVDAQCVVLFLF